MNACKKNPRDFWRIVTQAKPKQNRLTEYDIFSAARLLEHFKKLNMCGEYSTPMGVITTAIPYIPVLDNLIDQDEVVQAIICLKSNRAPGIDGIPAEVYKVLKMENLYQFSQSSSIISLPLAVFHKDGQPELSPLYIKEGQEMNPQTTAE